MYVFSSIFSETQRAVLQDALKSVSTGTDKTETSFNDCWALPRVEGRTAVVCRSWAAETALLGQLHANVRSTELRLAPCPRVERDRVLQLEGPPCMGSLPSVFASKDCTERTAWLHLINSHQLIFPELMAGREAFMNSTLSSLQFSTSVSFYEP